jgi:zinc and cadmium transporter
VSPLAWIVGSALAMSAIAWVGLLTLALREDQLNRLLLPLVAFAAGSLLAGAFLHLLPEAVAARGAGVGTFLPVLAGFALFFLMEQFLAWHHTHSMPAAVKQPVTYLILLADGLHNFIGGLAIGASFLVSTEVGIVTWIAAAAHEVPQELGDFGILIRGGGRKWQALLANFVSAAAILPGALMAYYVSAGVDIALLLSFAAGNFIYIAASDLVPEVKHDRLLRNNLIHFASFVAGMLVILATRLLFEP